MKLYIVEVYDYEGWVCGVFDTREKAIAWVQTEGSDSQEYSVSEWVINKGDALGGNNLDTGRDRGIFRGGK
jgi:hypothetical protein